MIDIREHGGSFGGGKLKGVYITDLAQPINTPSIKTLSIPTTNCQVKIDYNGQYIYVIKYSSENMSVVDIYDTETLTLVKSLSVNAYYYFMTCFYTIGNKLFITVYSGNLNDSWEYCYVYDRTTWTRVSQLGRGTTFNEIFAVDGTYVYGLVSYKTSGLPKFRKMSHVDYTAVDVTGPATDSNYIPIYSAGIIVWKDFYNSSNRGAVKFDGSPTGLTVPNEIFTPSAYPARTGDIVYGLYNSSSGDYKNRYVYYFTKSLQLLKSELISPSGGEWDPYSQLSFNSMYVQKDKKYMYIGRNGALYIQDINANGYFVDGQNTLSGLEFRNEIQPAFNVVINEGKADIFITVDYTKGQIKKITNYLTIK